jgi:hypothetical protein
MSREYGRLAEISPHVRQLPLPSDRRVPTSIPSLDSESDAIDNPIARLRTSAPLKTGGRRYPSDAVPRLLRYRRVWRLEQAGRAKELGLRTARRSVSHYTARSLSRCRAARPGYAWLPPADVGRGASPSSACFCCVGDSHATGCFEARMKQDRIRVPCDNLTGRMVTRRLNGYDIRSWKNRPIGGNVAVTLHHDTM